MKFRTFLGIVAVLVLAGMRAADGGGGTFRGGIDPSVTRVLAGGTWSSGSESGTCRVVVQDLGWEHTRSYLYVQWLKNDAERQAVTEFMTLPVGEFNADWANVSDLHFEKDTFDIYFILRTDARGDKIRARLRPRAPGKYDFHVDKK